jgi:hypothetical protein
MISTKLVDLIDDVLLVERTGRVCYKEMRSGNRISGRKASREHEAHAGNRAGPSTHAHTAYSTQYQHSKGGTSRVATQTIRHSESNNTYPTTQNKQGSHRVLAQMPIGQPHQRHNNSGERPRKKQDKASGLAVHSDAKRRVVSRLAMHTNGSMRFLVPEHCSHSHRPDCPEL